MHEYAIATYWTLQTITTVGYGDVDIENNVERLYGSIVMIGGVILFTVANASLMTIAADLDESGDYKDKTDTLIEMVKEYDIHVDY